MTSTGPDLTSTLIHAPIACRVKLTACPSPGSLADFASIRLGSRRRGRQNGWAIFGNSSSVDQRVGARASVGAKTGQGTVPSNLDVTDWSGGNAGQGLSFSVQPSPATCRRQESTGANAGQGRESARSCGPSAVSGVARSHGCTLHSSSSAVGRAWILRPESLRPGQRRGDSITVAMRRNLRRLAGASASSNTEPVLPRVRHRSLHKAPRASPDHRMSAVAGSGAVTTTSVDGRSRGLRSNQRPRRLLFNSNATPA